MALGACRRDLRHYPFVGTGEPVAARAAVFLLAAQMNLLLGPLLTCWSAIGSLSTASTSSILGLPPFHRDAGDDDGRCFNIEQSHRDANTG